MPNFENLEKNQNNTVEDDSENEMIVNSKEEFINAIRKWKSSPDGEHFCSDCWGKYIDKLNRIDPELIKSAKEDSSPLSKIVETCKSRDGYMALCNDCRKSINYYEKK